MLRSGLYCLLSDANRFGKFKLDWMMQSVRAMATVGNGLVLCAVPNECLNLFQAALRVQCVPTVLSQGLIADALGCAGARFPFFKIP